MAGITAQDVLLGQGGSTAAPRALGGTSFSTPYSVPPIFANGSTPPEDHGFLHTLLGLPGKTLHDFESAAINAPAGLYHLAGAGIHHPLGTAELVAQQTFNDLRHPLRHPGFTLLDLWGLAGGVGAIAGRAGEVGSVLSRGGELPEALSSLEKATTAGKTAAYNRIINPATGEVRSVGHQVTQALLHGAAVQERLLTTPEGLVQHGWWYSKNPTIKAGQQLVDKLHETFPDTGPPIWRIVNPLLWRSQHGRILSAAKAEVLATANVEKGTGLAYLKRFGSRPDAEHMAVRMIGEGITPEAMRAMHQRILDSGVLSPKMTAEMIRRNNLIPEAEKFLDFRTVTHPETGREFKLPIASQTATPEFHEFVNRSRELSNARTEASLMAGVLGTESSTRRLLGPFNFTMHGEIPDNITAIASKLQNAKNLGHTSKIKGLEDELNHARGQLSFDDMQAASELVTGPEADWLAKEGNLFRIPYKLDKGNAIDYGSTAFRRAWKGNRKKPPGTYTHAFEAGILKHGGGQTNVAKLLAESYTEAQRFLAFKKNRERILASAQDTPEGIAEGHARLIRTDDMITGGIASQARAAEMAYETAEARFLEADNLTPEQSIMGGKLYEGIRAHTFPKVFEHIKELALQGKEEVANAIFGNTKGQFQKVAGYKWIDDRLLGGLDKQNPLWGAFENGLVRKAIKLVDTINNAQKAVILYLKPAYAFPNMLGNLALNLIQQGFLAPWNLSRSFLAFKLIDPVTRAHIRAAMGEGLQTGGLVSQGISNTVFRTGNKLANAYGKFVDEPFRFSAFLHEAHLNGYTTAKELRTLTQDAGKRDEFEQIANRANDEIINYERLGPGEQAILRRLVFFYPWVKGSTRYASHFVKDHPVGTGIVAAGGQEGGDYIKQVLGEPLSYAEGLIPYSHKNPDFPEVGNPASFSILQEPAELAEKLTNIVEGHPKKGFALSGNLAPVDAALLTLITAGKYTTLSHPAGESPAWSAFHEVAGGDPITALINNLQGKSGTGAPLNTSIYPDSSHAHALLRFLLTGGLTPRVYDKRKAEYRAWLENNQTGFTSSF